MATATINEDKARRAKVALELRTAAQWIDAGRKLLNPNFKVCGECGLKHYESFAEAQILKELNGAHDKMYKLAAKLESM